MFAKQQYIGAASLLLIAIASWVFVATRPAPQSYSSHDQDFHRLDSLRRDSIAHARATRDSLRQARWEFVKDSFRIVDSLRFLQWTRERQARYDSFRLADSLWRDSVGFRYPMHPKKDTVLDLNHCDTTELQLIRGIGRYTALKIVKYRNDLGGYYTPQQLTDEYFAKIRLDTLVRHFTASPSEVQMIDVNSCSVERLRAHPYIRFEQAKSIYELRRKRIRLHSIDDLRVLPNLTESDLQRLAPYLCFL